MNYSAILPLITQGNYYWDALAVVPYLSTIGTTPATYSYVTYDDPTSIESKVRYIKSQNLGGWVIWHIGMDYVPSASRPHPLLDAVVRGGQ